MAFLPGTTVSINGRTSFYLESNDYREQIKKGSFILKTGKKVETEGKVLTFEDGSELEADLIVFATGYALKYPFLDDTDLLSYFDENQGIGPLFHRTVSIKDTSLFFPGITTSIANNQGIMERQVIFTSKIISGEIELPSIEEMTASFEDDIVTCKENRRRYLMPTF